MARRILKHIGGYAHGKEAVAEAKNGVPPVFKILGPDERLPHKSILASQTVLDVELSDGQRWQIPMSSLQT